MPACEEFESFGGGGSGLGGGDAEGLFRVVGGREGFIAQYEVADDGVVKLFGAVSALEYVVVGPPASEIGVVDGQFADQFGQCGSCGCFPA